ncbi:MAG: hypothetical protein K2X67_06945 [Burkholderiales bacterium]|jgi:hypothetical protein|nr:hypothetical protein [Burkholderiales bacterium]
MFIPESDDDFFPDDHDRDPFNEQIDEATHGNAAEDLFSEQPRDPSEASSADLHGQFEGDVHAGLMARIATGGAIKE